MQTEQVASCQSFFSKPNGEFFRSVLFPEAPWCEGKGYGVGLAQRDVILRWFLMLLVISSTPTQTTKHPNQNIRRVTEEAQKQAISHESFSELKQNQSDISKLTKYT